VFEKCKIYCAMAQNAKHYVIRKIPKHHAQNIETLCGTSCLKYRWYAQNTEILTYYAQKQRYLYM